MALRVNRYYFAITSKRLLLRINIRLHSIQSTPQLINFDSFFVPPASERTCVLAEITGFGVQRMAYETRARILYPLSCEARFMHEVHKATI